MAVMRDRMKRFMLQEGETATLTVITGDECRCFTYRDSAHPRYDPEWHAQNPTAEDCQGTGLVNRTETVTTIKAFFHHPAHYSAEVQSKENKYVEVGELLNGELIMQGTFDTSGNFIDMSSYTEKTARITYLGTDYYKIATQAIMCDGEIVMQIVGLKRNA